MRSVRRNHNNVARPTSWRVPSKMSLPMELGPIRRRTSGSSAGKGEADSIVPPVTRTPLPSIIWYTSVMDSCTTASGGVLPFTFERHTTDRPTLYCDSIDTTRSTESATGPQLFLRTTALTSAERTVIAAGDLVSGVVDEACAKTLPDAVTIIINAIRSVSIPSPSMNGGQPTQLLLE
jgi:hypothetical protein